MRPLRHLFQAIGCALLVATLSAQPAQPAHVTLRMLSFDGIITDLSVSTPQGPKHLVAMPTGIGGEINALVSEGGVEFFRFVPPSPAGAAPAPAAPEQPVTRFAIQPGVTRYLVIVGAAGQGAGRTYQTYATPDEPGSLPQGWARVINFTETPLAVQLGQGTRIIEASRTAVMQCPSSTVQMDLKLARPSDSDGWDLMTSTSIEVPDGRRLVLLIAPQRPRQSTAAGVIQAAPSAFALKILFDTPAPAAPSKP